MNTLIKYKNIALLLVSVCGLASCTDNFTEWNTNPDEATEEMMSKDNLKTGAYFLQMQKNVFVVEQLSATPEIGASVYQVTQNLTGDSFSGYTGALGNWFGGSNFTTYNMMVSWRNAAFERSFVGVMPSWNAINKISDDNPTAAALATIVKVEALHRTTDMYGPLPYLSFGKGELQNDYDSQEAIYRSFFEELGHSIDVLTDFYSQSPSARVMEQYDFIYQGDVKKWIAFANTLRLRLAIRIAYAAPALAQTEAEKSVNHTIGVITSVGEVAQLNQSSDLSYRHPLAVIQTEFDDVRMGATMDSYLNGYNDPRLSAYFKPSSDNKYTGVRNGITINSKDTYTKAPFSLINISYSTPIVWMNPAEAYFLRAEGALRGWDMKGTAEVLYEKGVRVSFEYNGVAGVDGYLQDAVSVPANYTDPVGGNSTVANGTCTIQWDESASFENKMERIITQKWIAIFPDGQEAWSEFRRTGYPKVFPNVANRSGGTISTETQVRRIPFPLDEYNNNLSAVKSALLLLNGDDNGGTKLWWDKK